MTRNIFIKIIFFSGLMFLPGLVSGAYNNITYTADSVVSFSSPSTTVTIKSGANINNLVVNPGSMVITLERSLGGNSNITLVPGDTTYTINDVNGNYGNCGLTPVNYTGPSTIGTTTVTITPRVCSNGGGGGGLPGNAIITGWATGQTTAAVAPTPAATPVPSPIPITIPSPNPLPTPTIATPSPTAAANQIVAANPLLASIPALFVRALFLGAKGKDVSALQLFLKLQGTAVYPEGIVSGKFGLLTKKAVQRFQIMYGIARSGDRGFGRMGPNTIAKIKNLLGF